MTDSKNSPHDDYDSPWKDVLEMAFPEFMAFYFPHAHAQIDWAQGFEFQNIELRQVVQDAELGKRLADTLVRVTLLTGEYRLICIHIEVQGWQDANFPQRMFIYNYRLYDRYGYPIVSLAVLADDDASWRPDHFGFEALGCRHTFEFPTVKLLDYVNQQKQLETDPNPFALVTFAHLQTQQTKHDTQARYTAKIALLRLLGQRKWPHQRKLDLFAVLDWMMRLPKLLEHKLWQAMIEMEGETHMKYVTSLERFATQQGRLQGLQEGEIRGEIRGEIKGEIRGKLKGESLMLERVLAKRFGLLSDDIRSRLKSATAEQLEHWADICLEAPTLSAIFEGH